MVEHTTDRTFEVETNYFRVNFPEKVYIYMYNVEFTEARKRMIMKKQSVPPVNQANHHFQGIHLKGFLVCLQDDRRQKDEPVPTL